MSAFQNAFARAADVMGASLGDGLCSYESAAGTVPDIHYQLNRAHQLYDQHGVAQLVTSVNLRADLLPASSRRGDRVVTPGRTWTVEQTLEDDGHFRLLYVV